ncbi:diguanylate cyclase [Gilvimarinus sp. SDUM040013]|uniref:diguanylate cyclase n=1 Tax=Gilvimarinus gilvus TaxID=3058038 RepID=A0ABU4S2S6_9GAMM|nr:diguanylate cyclase [Gilvimarinus sp. SDUM040013]MDO3384719.1 diguanylate cyclase [Gilvimarinus sp. SDUM040013]MDX6850806.1 diguanylate cyclase [Gilvimarinus sp. SDUM040013]
MSRDSKKSVLEKLAKLRAEYGAHLPVELAKIAGDASKLSEIDDAKLLQELHRRLHKLAGSAGSFGFPNLSQRARELELAIQEWLNVGAPDAITRSQIISNLANLESGIAEPTDTHGRPEGHSAHGPDKRRNTVYVVEDDHHLAREVEAALISFGYDVHHFDQLKDAESAILSRRPDFLIVDVVFEGEQELGPQSIARLQGAVDDPLSVIFISSHDDFETYLSAVRAGAIGYFVKPLDIAEVIDCLESHLNLSQSASYRVLIVDDDELLARHYKLVLEAAGMMVEVVNDPRQVLTAMDSFHPEVVLLDLNLPTCRGYELAQLIRLNPAWLRVAIAYLSSEQDEQAQAFAIRHGGEDFLTKPISDLRLVSAVSVRAARARQLSDAIDRDSLTGLLKHSRIKEQVNIELQRAARQNKPVSVAMIDLDHFKKVNDTYGHPVGDKVIRALSQLLRQRLRKTDSIGRYGGEEFVAVLPECDQDSAVTLLEGIRESFAALGFSVDNKSFNVTLSAGIATAISQSGDVLEAADKALYQAKSSGRNRVAAGK